MRYQLPEPCHSVFTLPQSSQLISILLLKEAKHSSNLARHFEGFTFYCFLIPSVNPNPCRHVSRASIQDNTVISNAPVG